MEQQAPAFWEEAWQLARRRSIFRANDLDSKAYWNKRAGNFSKNTTGKQGSRRVAQILGWLQQEGVDFSGSRILDIGAGPGSFAVPMAKLAREVVAIEPSEQMVNLMGSYAQEEGVSNLRIITASWDEQFALEDHGLGGKFELVFSSMNPGIVNWTTLEKAIKMASKYCYISTFAGKRDNPALKELWTQLYREPMPPWPGEIFYIVNLLYTKGYQFSFKVWEETSQELLPVDEAAHLLAEMLARYGGKNLEEVWEPTLAYVKSRANEGNEFSQEITTRLGKILICL